MEGASDSLKARTVGVLILAEFGFLEDEDFIDFTCGSLELHPRLYLRWREPDKHREEGFKINSGQCEIPFQGRNSEAHLYTLPASLLHDFNLSDLLFPVEVTGCLLIANCYVAHTILLAKSENKPNRTRQSWLTWIQEQNIPFLVAATDSEVPALTIEQLRNYLGLKPDVQVQKISSHFATEKKQFVFNLAEPKQILTALVEKIMTNTPGLPD